MQAFARPAGGVTRRTCFFSSMSTRGLLGIDIQEVCATLERNGVEKFVDSYEKLQIAIDRRLQAERAPWKHNRLRDRKRR